MDRIRDSIRASCSSPFSSSTGLSFKRRPTSQINEEDGQADLFKDTATLQDRAARKEIERVRLRKLLNQGKKKRRRLNGDKLVASPRNGASLGPVDDFHCHTREPHVPRKSRSVGYRRKGKSWKLIGLRLLGEQIELPPTKVEKASPLSVVQNENEIEFEIAEVLSGLKKQVSSSDELLIDDFEKIPVGDDAKIKLERCTSDSGNLTSQLSVALPESTQSKQPVKFVIDLNEPPPLESSLEDDKMEDWKAYPEDEVVKGELQDLDLGNSDCNKNEQKQLFQKQQKGYSYASFQTDLLGPERISPTGPAQGISFCRNLNSIQYGKQGFEFYSHNINQENNPRRASNLKIKDEHAYHQIHDPLQSGRMMTVMANNAVSPSSNRNVRIGYPSRPPFLSVLPRNVCTNGGKLPFLDPQMCLPIEIQQRKHLPHTTQAMADNRTITSQTNVFQQSLFPLHSRSLVLMPSASSGQWKYAKYAQCHSSDEAAAAAAAQALNSSMPHNHVAAPSFLDKANFGSPADHELQYRHSEMMIQRVNQADSSLVAGNSSSWIKQSGFVLKSCSNISPAPNCKLSFSKQNGISAVELKNQQQQLQAMATSQLKRVSTVNNQHQQPTVAKVSNDYRSSTLHNPQPKLTISSSHIQI